MKVLPEKRVGIVLPENADYNRRLLDGTIEYVAEHPNILLEEFDFMRGKAPHWLRTLPECDGWLLWVESDNKWVKRLLATDRPIVNTCGGWPLDRVAVVAFGAHDIAHLAVEHLAKPGIRSLGFVGCNINNRTPQRKLLDLFLEMAEKRGLRVVKLDLREELGAAPSQPRLTPYDLKTIRAFIGKLELPAAVWCLSDAMALPVVDMAQELGLRVPEQVAVLGLGDQAGARFFKPTLSSIPQPAEIVGYEAMRLLDGLMAGQAMPDRPVVINTPPVVARESTSSSDQARPSMKRAYDYLVEHACQNVSVDDLLPIAGISRPTFIKRFVALYGRTPGVEIRRVRLERAQYYLRHTTFSITRITEMCGFESTDDFSHFFKRECKQSPSRYRRNEETRKRKG